MRDEAYKLTPAQVVARHVFRLVQETSTSMAAFVADVRELHEARYPDHSRTVEWSTQADAAARFQRDEEKFHRWLMNSPRCRLPVEVLDAVVLAMPAGRRLALEEELATARGGWFVPFPETAAGAGPDAASVGAMIKEVGDAITATGRLIEDGEINAADAATAPGAITELDEAIAKLMEVRYRIVDQALGGEDPAPASAEGVPQLRRAK